MNNSLLNKSLYINSDIDFTTDKQPEISTKDYLSESNCLSEFDTEQEKTLARENLGITKEFIQGMVGDVSGLEDLKAQVELLTSGAKATISASPSVLKHGVTTEVSIKVSLVTNNNSAASKFEMSDGTTTKEVLNPKTSSHTWKQNVTLQDSEEITFKALVSYKNIVLPEVSTKIKAYHCIWCGFGNSIIDIKNLTLDGMTELKVRNSMKGTFSGTAEQDCRYYIFVPDGVELSDNLVQGGQNWPHTKESKIIDEITYSIFIGNELSVGNVINIEAK